MLAGAGRRVAEAGVQNVVLREGRAEAIPVEDMSVDVVVASLSLMYALDRSVTA